MSLFADGLFSNLNPEFSQHPVPRLYILPQEDSKVYS